MYKLPVLFVSWALTFNGVGWPKFGSDMIFRDSKNENIYQFNCTIVFLVCTRKFCTVYHVLIVKIISQQGTDMFLLRKSNYTCLREKKVYQDKHKWNKETVN